jgi:hypothetical protein
MPGERGEGGFSLLRGLPEVLKNLVVIGLIVAIAAGLQKALKITTKKWRRTVPTQQPDPSG